LGGYFNSKITSMEKNQYNLQGLKEGYWEDPGAYKRGVRVGEWIFYKKNGKISEIKNYEDYEEEH